MSSPTEERADAADPEIQDTVMEEGGLLPLAPALPTGPPVNHIAKLSLELILGIVSQLDPASAVCLALTSHSLNAVVLQGCNVATLSEVCPRDVGDPIPALVVKQAFNILMPALPMGFGWRVSNPRTSMVNSDQYARNTIARNIQLLALTRRLKWVAQSLPPSRPVVAGRKFDLLFSTHGLRINVELDPDVVDLAPEVLAFFKTNVNEAETLDLAFLILYGLMDMDSAEWTLLQEKLVDWKKRV